MEKWKTSHSEYIFKTPFGNLRKDTCETSTGITIDAYYVNEYADWVNAIVVTPEKQLVLVEQYRYAGGDFFLEVPAGTQEVNETLEEAIIREVKEETGYVSKKQPIKLGAFMVNPATQTNKVITYLILDAEKVTEQTLDTTEDIHIHLIDFDAMSDELLSNRINTQLFTAHAYWMAKAYFSK